MSSLTSGEAQTRSGTAEHLGVVIAAVVIGAAALLRFWDLSAAPLWMDEAFTVLVGRLPLHIVLFGAIDNHPPLPYAIQVLWTDLFPSLALARAPAAIEGALTVIVVMACMRDLISGAAALWAGALFAVMPSHVWFSQDARMYPMLLLGLVVAIWGMIGLSDARRKPLAFYTAVYISGAGLAVYSHFLALLFLAAINLAALGVLISRRAPRAAFLRWLFVNLVLFVIAIPWLLQLLSTAGSFPGLGRSEGGLRVIGFFLRNAIGFPSLDPSVGLDLQALLLALTFAGAVLAWRAGERPFTVVLAVSMPAYVALTLILNSITPVLATRVFLPLLSPIVMLAGAALGDPRYQKWLLAPGLLLVGGMSVATAVEHGMRTKHDNPRSALAAALAAGYRGAPVITCNFLNASAYVIAAEGLNVPQTPVITHVGDEPMRFDARAFGVVSMSMAKLRAADAAQLDHYLGGGYLYPDGLAGALRSYDKAVLVTQPCVDGDAFEARVLPRIEAAGFHLVKKQSFSRPGRAVMECGETEIMLLQRNG